MSPTAIKYFNRLPGRIQAQIITTFIRRELHGNTLGYPHIIPYVLDVWKEVGPTESKKLFFQHPDYVTMKYINMFRRYNDK